MTHVLELASDDPVIYLKAYGGVQIKGVENTTTIACEIAAPQLATLIEEDGHVYVTVNASCHLTVPVKSSITIERGMGSVLIEGVQNPINIEKVLGNLVLLGVGQAVVGKVGGNLSARNVSGLLRADKIAGSLTVEDAQALICGKVGGNCVLRQIHAEAQVDKAGGSCRAQDIFGEAILARFGGSIKAKGVNLGADLKVGGSIELFDCHFARDLRLAAGGNILVALPEDQTDLTFVINSSGQKIKVQAKGEDLKLRKHAHVQEFGEDGQPIELSAGGSVSLIDDPRSDENFIGDLSDRFAFEESAFSEMVQERIESATRRAEAKVKAAEIRLSQIQDRVEKFREIDLDVDLENEAPETPSTFTKQPVPPVRRPAGKKGATDEERLMILNMLEKGTINVDEAEALFKAMES